MEGDGLEVRPARDDEEVEAAKALRLRVFAEEQGISPEAEVDGLDPEATHILILRNGETVATCRLRFPRGTCKLERMAVERTLRETGIGTKLLEEAEREAVRQGSEEMILHAQLQVEGFYASCGYVAAGETFLEEGIEHVKMRKALLESERRSGRDRRR